jgi:hypothetical protein
MLQDNVSVSMKCIRSICIEYSGSVQSPQHPYISRHSDSLVLGLRPSPALPLLPPPCMEAFPSCLFDQLKGPSLALGPLPLALGPWPLALGPWPLALGPWPLALGPSALAKGRYDYSVCVQPFHVTSTLYEIRE